ncbi:MAG TPA: RNA chaperone Hfq [Terracidiphilus sp.]|nr:RNA chaperone Hfq [Terracidiphilus sp.]
MIPEALLNTTGAEAAPQEPSARRPRAAYTPLAYHFHNHEAELEAAQPHAEVFYLQKQIQSQTPMVIVLTDGERVEGCIEWYDSKTLKVRGRVRTLVYKSAIKYMYKLGENGQ